MRFLDKIKRINIAKQIMSADSYVDYEDMHDDLVNNWDYKGTLSKKDLKNIKYFFTNLNKDVTTLSLAQLENRYANLPTITIPMYYQILLMDLSKLSRANCEQTFIDSLMGVMMFLENCWRDCENERGNLWNFTKPYFRKFYNEQYQN